MFDEHLPGSSSPKTTKRSSVKKVASHIFGQMRRPSRMRGRFRLGFITLLGIFLLHLGHRHADDIRSTASSLGIYMPNQLTDAFAQDQELDWLQWDDSQDHDLKNLTTTVKGPAFRLMIPTSRPTSTLNLCRTILSAAILDYPPPTLLGYGNEQDMDRSSADVMQDALNDAHEDDLVLVVDENTLFQLSGEVLISRFFHTTRDSTYALLQEYGRYPGNSTTPPSQQPQRYYTNVLFGAQKDCADQPKSPACYFAPSSTLPVDPYDPFELHESEYRRPRYITPRMVMGTVGHLRPILKYASDLLDTDMAHNCSQDVLSQIFGAQEYERILYHQSTLGLGARIWKWIASLILVSTADIQGPLLNQTTLLNNSNTSRETTQREFGIGLDYTSSMFQPLDSSSARDVQFVRFSNLSNSLNISEQLRKKIHLPFDLNNTALPYALHLPSEDPLTAVDTLPRSLTWSDVSLATNILIPESPSIPSVLSISPQVNDSIQLWYEPYAQVLFRQSLHAPPMSIIVTIPPPLPLKLSRHISVEQRSASLKSSQRSSGPREISYMDLRGGRGGIWTEKGEWKEWDEVCGSFHDVLFPDGKEVLGKKGRV